MADTVKQQLDEIEVQIMSLQRQLRASMDRFQVLYNQVSGSGASAEQAAADALGYKTDAETAAGTCTEAVTTVQGMIEGFSGNVEGKMDKIVDPVAGNVPTMTADGSLQTSVLALTDLAVKHPAGAGYFAVYDAEGGLNASGFHPGNVMAKPAGAVTGNVATYGTAGAVVDSNVALTAFVRHDTAQSLSNAARDAVLANIGTGLKYSVLNAVGKKALMRAALLASGQAVHIYLNSTSAFASFALIPAATTPPTLMKSMSPIGLDISFEAGFEEHSALFRFGVAYGNSGTAGAGAGVMHIAALNQTTVQVPCSFADGAYGSLTLTCADASTVVIRSLYTSKSTEYLWLRIGARSGGVKPVYVYDYATSAWKLLINCPSTTDGFRHPQFGFVLGAGFGSCHLKHDNLHGSLVYPSAISISDIF